MKKRIGAISVVFFTVLFLLVGTQAVLAKKQIILRYATQMPKTHQLTKADFRFAELVEKRTGGRVKIEVYPAGQLYKGSSLVSAVRSGALDMGIIYGGAMTGPVPLIDVFDIPFLFSDYRTIQKYWQGEIGSMIRNQAEKKGIHILSFGAYGDSFCIINNKRFLKTPDDFKGLKIRGNTPMSMESIKALGGVPLRMSSSEVYAAIQRGTIDGASTGLGSVITRNWFEVGQYATITSSSYSVWPVMINRKVWNSLPADIRDIIKKTAAENENYIIGNVVKNDRNYTAQMKRKMKVYTLNKHERETWAKALANVRREFVKRTGKDGERILGLLNQ